MNTNPPLKIAQGNADFPSSGIGRLLSVVHGELSRQQLQDVLALKSRDNFDKRYLKPALVLGLIEPTMPDKPNSRHQKYRLTHAG